MTHILIVRLFEEVCDDDLGGGPWENHHRQVQHPEQALFLSDHLKVKKWNCYLSYQEWMKMNHQIRSYWDRPHLLCLKLNQAVNLWKNCLLFDSNREQEVPHLNYQVRFQAMFRATLETLMSSKSSCFLRLKLDLAQALLIFHQNFVN